MVVRRGRGPHDGQAELLPDVQVLRAVAGMGLDLPGGRGGLRGGDRSPEQECQGGGHGAEPHTGPHDPSVTT